MDLKYTAFTPWMVGLVAGKINPTDVFTRLLPLAVVVLVVPIRPDAHFPRDGVPLEVFVPRVVPCCIVTDHLPFFRRGCVRRNVLRQDEFQPFERENTPPKSNSSTHGNRWGKDTKHEKRTQESQHETPA